MRKETLSAYSAIGAATLIGMLATLLSGGCRPPATVNVDRDASPTSNVTEQTSNLTASDEATSSNVTTATGTVVETPTETPD